MAGIRTCDRESQVQRPIHYTTEPPVILIQIKVMMMMMMMTMMLLTRILLLVLLLVVTKRQTRLEKVSRHTRRLEYCLQLQ